MERKEVEELIIKLKHIAPYIDKDRQKLLICSGDIIGAIDEEGLEDYAVEEFALETNDIALKLYSELERQKTLIEKLINYVEAGFKSSKEPPLDFYISLNNEQKLNYKGVNND